MVRILQFSEALDACADDDGYQLAPVIKAEGKGKNRKPATTKLGSLVPVALANYSASNHSATLASRVKRAASKPWELIVNGALLTDTLGREIDGADNDQAGSDFIATISGPRVTTGGIPLARVQRRPGTVADAIDRLLGRGELADVNGPSRGERIL